MRADLNLFALMSLVFFSSSASALSPTVESTKRDRPAQFFFTSQGRTGLWTEGQGKVRYLEWDKLCGLQRLTEAQAHVGEAPMCPPPFLLKIRYPGCNEATLFQ